MGVTNQVVVRDEPPILWIGINRPEKRNALSLELVEELERVLRVHRGKPSVVILHSCVEGVFVSGADIAELEQRRANDAMMAINIGLCEAIATFRWPVVAAIDGVAFGGGLEMALAADLRIASETSRFAQPELGLGIIAGAGANFRLRETVGLTGARELLYLGRVWDAKEALSRGLVNEVVTQNVLDRAARVALEVAERPFSALELTKLALAQGSRSTSHFDRVAQALLFESPEKEARMQAFLSRKKSRK